VPVHDWSRVSAGIFHDFHQAWITALRDILNEGGLPEGYYAMAEKVAGHPHPDVLTLEEYAPASDWTRDDQNGDMGVALALHPPKVRYTLEAEETLYAAKANRIAIYHTSGDRVVAFIEIVSPGNKRGQIAVNQLLEKLAAALQQGRHLLVIDLQRPGKHDPDGLHAAFWGTTPGVTADQPLSLAAYRADVSPTAYFEPIAVGDSLVDMPLFLTPDMYVNIPLEATYQTAWRGVPKRWKRALE
jgi:hypothetical protein